MNKNIDKNIDKKALNNLYDSLQDSHNSNAFLMGIVASSLATIGLATNSQTTLIGSMLLSPIGSLIIKNILYPFLIKNKFKLNIKYKKWIIQIIMVLIITLIISYLLGKLLHNFKNPFKKDDEKLSDKWPTSEMISRADPVNAIYMILIALMCGIALPIALINKSGIKLVAIGIATALIPPIANIGLSLSLKGHRKYKKNAIITGLSIFLINCSLLKIPSIFILDEIVKKKNRFKYIEKLFIYPKMIFNISKFNEFFKIDKDGDGKISKNEYKEYFKSLKKYNKLKGTKNTIHLYDFISK